MSDAKWTRGPYYATPRDEVAREDEFDREDVFGIVEVLDPVERRATALLWAAAPDLYAALDRMLQAFGGPGETTSPACAAALAALARARGETP